MSQEDSLIPTERPRHWRLLDRLIDGGGTAIVFAMLWAGFGFFIVVFSGLWPDSPGRWILYIFLAPIAWVAGEALVEGFRALPFLKRTRNRIDEETRHQSFSGVRIAYLFMETVVFLALLMAIGWLVGLPPLG